MRQHDAYVIGRHVVVLLTLRDFLAPAVSGDLHGQQREALPLAGHQPLEARLAERRRGRAAIAAAACCTPKTASTSEGMSAS
jgi:hypothetical protein